MQAPIAIDYTRDGDDWKVTARRSDEHLQATAPGLIAARDKADQLIDQLAADDEEKTVVHLLDGDAFAFTEAYLHARLDRPGANGSSPATGGSETAGAPGAAEAGEQATATAQPTARTQPTATAQPTETRVPTETTAPTAPTAPAGSDEAPRASSA